MNQSVVILFRHIFNKCVKFAPTIHEDFNTSYQEEKRKKSSRCCIDHVNFGQNVSWIVLTMACFFGNICVINECLGSFYQSSFLFSLNCMTSYSHMPLHIFIRLLSIHTCFTIGYIMYPFKNEVFYMDILIPVIVG